LVADCHLVRIFPASPTPAFPTLGRQGGAGFRAPLLSRGSLRRSASGGRASPVAERPATSSEADCILFPTASRQESLFLAGCDVGGTPPMDRRKNKPI
jgi:hypothetical protein